MTEIKFEPTELRPSGLPMEGSPFQNRDGTMQGKVVGYRRCTLSGCRSTQMGVRWPDGRLTWPCAKGCVVTEDGTWKIGE